MHPFRGPLGTLGKGEILDFWYIKNHTRPLYLPQLDDPYVVSPNLDLYLPFGTLYRSHTSPSNLIMAREIFKQFDVTKIILGHSNAPI